MGCKQSKSSEPIQVVGVEHDNHHHHKKHHFKATEKPDVHFDKKLDPPGLPGSLADHGVVARSPSQLSARGSQRGSPHGSPRGKKE